MAFVLRSLVSRAFYSRIVRSDRVKKNVTSLWSSRRTSSRLFSTRREDHTGPNQGVQCHFNPNKFSCFKCWSCEHVAHEYSFFCHHCNTVQPPCKHCNYFEYFNCSTTFDLDVDRLGARYKDLQRHLHPDIFSKKSKEEQILSLEQSAMVNDAYKILKQPYTRAAYLLKLHGVDVEQENQSISDPELLGTVMDMREAIEEAEDMKQIDDIAKHITAKHDECIAALKDTFANSDLDRARKWTITLKYYTKLQEEVENKRLRVR